MVRSRLAAQQLDLLLRLVIVVNLLSNLVILVPNDFPGAPNV
jgi:hypothetical protein